jgi:hypothetical protein
VPCQIWYVVASVMGLLLKPEDGQYTIHDLEKLSGVKARTIRKYREFGIFDPITDKVELPKALFCEDHLTYLLFIKVLQEKVPRIRLATMRDSINGIDIEVMRNIVTGSEDLSIGWVSEDNMARSSMMDSSAVDFDWLSVPVNADLEIRAKGPYAENRMRLKLLASLLRNALEYGESEEY